MASIKFTVTNFSTPNLIGEETYHLIKKELNRNPSLNLMENETILDRFHTELFSIVLSIVLLILGMIIPFIAIPSTFCLLIYLGYFLLEFPSYSNYLTKKRSYYSKLKYSICRSANYNEFVDLFQSRHQKTFTQPYNEWLSTLPKEKKSDMILNVKSNFKKHGIADIIPPASIITIICLIRIGFWVYEKYFKL